MNLIVLVFFRFINAPAITTLCSYLSELPFAAQLQLVSGEFTAAVTAVVQFPFYQEKQRCPLLPSSDARYY